MTHLAEVWPPINTGNYQPSKSPGRSYQRKHEQYEITMSDLGLIANSIDI